VAVIATDHGTRLTYPVGMVKKIVGGVDDSETAAAAARKAAELAAALDAELVTISAYARFEAATVGERGDEVFLSTEQKALEIAKRRAADLRTLHPGLVVTPLAAEGRPADVLVEQAKEQDADMIVVGNKRVQGLASALGSIATEVARKAHCDVHVAHTHTR